MGTGYTTMMYGAERLETGIGDVAACQYDGIEIGLGKLRAAGPAAVAGWLDETDLELYLVMSDWVESVAAAERMAEAAATVADLGAEYFGVLPPLRDRHDDATVERMLQTIAEGAHDAGITPLLHHHGGTQVEGPDEIERYLGVADGLGLLFDTAHYYPYGEHYPDGDVTDGIERFADRIEYVHLKDVDPTAGFTDHRDRLTAGDFHLDSVINYFRAFTDLDEGILDFGAVADSLRAVGFDGHCTVEIENETEDPLVHAKRNRDAWLRLSETPV